MPTFTSDWFSHNIYAWENFLRQINFDPLAPRVAIEIGCYEGRASLWIANNMLLNDLSRLYCVDIFANHDQPNSYYNRFLANVSEEPKVRSKIIVERSPSFAFLNRCITESLAADFIYVDGSHRASEVLEDLVLSFRILKPGGLLICDDYLGGAGDGNDLTLGTPKIAVDAFTTIYRDRLEIISGQPLYQLAFRKTSARDDDDPTSRGLSAH
jgi:predicted O-methyltransferase YrrM